MDYHNLMERNDPLISSPRGQSSCICNRPTQDILCRSCGYLCAGRLQKTCPVHSKEIHLMDIKICPKCKLDCLVEVRERHNILSAPKDRDFVSSRDPFIVKPPCIGLKENIHGKTKLEMPSRYVDNGMQTDFSMIATEDKLMTSSVSIVTNTTQNGEIGLQASNDKLQNEGVHNKENEVMKGSPTDRKMKECKQEKEWVWGSNNTKNVGISDEYSVLKRAMQIRKSSIGQSSDDTSNERQF